MRLFLKDHKLLLATVLYGIPIVVYMFIGFSNSLTFENNNLNNALTLGFFLVPILVVYWLTFIRIKWLKYITIVIYVLILIPFYALSSLAILFIANDVVTLNNNGYRAIYEIPLDNNQIIIIYRTPDKGAFGGDWINVALVKRLGFGIIKRDFTKEIEYNDTYSTSGGKITFRGKEYDVPPLKEIESKGDLK